MKNFSETGRAPATPTTPAMVSVGGEMLARSPMGSVADLSGKYRNHDCCC